MFRQKKVPNGLFLSRLLSLKVSAMSSLGIVFALCLSANTAIAAPKSATNEPFGFPEALAIQSVSLRFDRLDAFKQTVARFQIQANTESLMGFLDAQLVQGRAIDALIQTHEQQVGQPYASWVAGLLAEYPHHSFRILTHLEKTNPYYKDDMRLALAAYLDAQYGQLAPANSAPVILTNRSSVQPLGLVQTEGLAIGETAGISGTAAIGAASSSVSVGTVALYSLAGTLAVAGSSLTGDSSTCKTCGPGNTLMGQNEQVFETTEYNAQQGLATINASTAYARGHDGDGVLVSVVDSPFQLDHPEFSGQLVKGYHVDDASYTAEVCSDNTTSSCSRGHGTHVASTIVGAKDNSSGMHGVAYNAKIKPIAFIAGSSSFTSTQLANMFDAASGVDNGTQIIAMNNSWGPTPVALSTGIGSQVYVAPDVSDATLEGLYHTWLSDAADAGTILVWAAGNDGWNSETGKVSIYASAADYASNPSSPLSTPLASDFVDNTSFTSANQVDYLTKLPSLVSDSSAYIIDESKDEYRWLTVVATDPTDNVIASFSNGCGATKNYCLAAPGVDIYAAIDGSSYGNKQGTSMAAPHVTGAIAVLADMYPDLEPEEIVAIILRSATDLGASGVDDVYGHGLLNLSKATGPLGSINLATVSSRGGVQLLSGSAQIQSPPMAGNALSSVNLALLDEYERLYEVKVPVTAQLLERLTLAERMKQTGASRSDVIQMGAHGALSFQVDNPDDVREVKVEYQQDTQNGLLKTGYSNYASGAKTVDETAAFSDDYSQYYIEPSISSTMQQTAYLGLEQMNEANGFGMSTNLRASHSDTGAIVQYSSGWVMERGPVRSKITIGGLSETASFMGAQMGGATALGDSGTRTIFGRLDVTASLGTLGQLDLFYVSGKSHVAFAETSLIQMRNLRHDSYGARLTKAFGDEGQNQLQAKIWRPLALTSGDLMINQITNYRRSGFLEASTNSYNLVPERETALSFDVLWGGLRAGVYHRMNALHQNGLNETGGFITTSIKL